MTVNLRDRLNLELLASSDYYGSLNVLSFANVLVNFKF
jgi:hypothetical protein